MIARLALPLLLLAALTLAPVLLLAEARRIRRHEARELEHAIRPPITLDPDDLDAWCCELAFLTRGDLHDGGEPPCAE